MEKKEAKQVEVKAVGLFWGWTTKTLSEAEKIKRKNVERTWGRCIRYKFGNVEIYNIAEVDAARLVENYINKVGVNQLTSWQKLIQFLSIWIAIGVLLIWMHLNSWIWKIGDKVKELDLKIIEVVKEITPEEKEKKAEDWGWEMIKEVIDKTKGKK